MMRILPTQKHVETVLAGSDTFGVRTLRSFLQSLARMHPKGFEPATRETTELATAVALNRIDQASPARDDGSSRGRPVGSALDDALGELRRAGVGPADLRRAGGERAQLLAALLEHTQATLERAHLFDDRALGWVAAEAIASLPSGDVPAETLVEGVHGFGPADYAWLEALACRGRVTVRLPVFANPSGGSGRRAERFAGFASEASDRLFSVLENRWHAGSRAPEIDPLHVRFAPESVELLETRSDTAEARAIARTVLSALDRGAEPERVAIVVPNLDEEILEPLRASLDEARIPFAEPYGRPPLSSPAADAALGWLALAAGPITRDKLVDLLRSPEIAPSFWVGGGSRRAGGNDGLSREQSAELARALSGLAVGADPDGGLLLSSLAEAVAGNADHAYMSDTLQGIVDRLLRLRARTTREAAIREVRAAWNDMGVGEIAPQQLARALGACWTRAPAARAWLAALRDRNAAMRALRAALDRWDEAARRLGVEHESITLADLQTEIELAASRAPPIDGARRSGAIRVVLARDAAGLAHDWLVVARAIEGAFVRSPRASALLDETLVASLPPSRRPPSAALEQAAADLELAFALSTARHVVVTRSIADADGRPRAPASWYAALAHTFSPVPVPASPLFAHPRALSAREQALVRLGRGEGPDDPGVLHRVQVERRRTAFFLDPRAPADAFTGRVELADPALGEHWMGLVGGDRSGRPLPATALERAAGCPFVVYASRVLRATRDEDATEELDARTRGSLVHRALHVAFEALAAGPRPASLVEAQSIALAAAERELATRGSLLHGAEVARALKAVLRVVRWSLEHEPNMAFWRGEQAFGSDEPGSWPALRIEDDEHVAYLSGRIDRIDRSTDGRTACIIDYKTGAIPTASEIETRLFQLPLYAKALGAALSSDPEAGPADSIRVLYLATSHPVRATPEQHRLVPPEKLARKEQEALRIVAGLQAGLVPPRPLKDDLCARCDARDLCRRPAVMPPADLPVEEGSLG